MREIDKIAEGLFEKIRDRFEDVSLGDEEANATQDPEQARFFNFDYVVDGQNYGNVTLSIVDEISLKAYFSKNISHDLTDEQRRGWYNFLKELREFAKRNLLSFEPRDITRSTLKVRDVKQVSKADSTYDKDEVVSEGRMYGTSRSSYENEGPVRIIVRHVGIVNPEQRGSRSRHIKAIYLETAEGERRKLHHNSLRYARAMARHLKEGGSVDDEFGQHITSIAEECSKLKPFKASMMRRVFEDDETQRMVEAAFEYHGLLNNTLNKMSGRKGYQQCKEQFVATSTSYIPEEEFDADSMRERFVKRTYNDRMNDALPIVYKAYNMKKTNKMAEAFESWATRLSEGTWAIPETEDDIKKLSELLQDPILVGVDGENASNALYNLIGDDELFDNLSELGHEDPEADARETIQIWLQTNLPEVYEQLQDLEPETEVSESGTGDTPFAQMSRSDLLDYLNLDPMKAQKLSNEQLRAAAEEKSQDMTESEYGSYGEIYEDEDGMTAEDLYWTFHHRIMSGLKQGQHGDLIRKLGPDGLMDAMKDYAEFHAGADEWGSSDTSGVIRNIYRRAGVEFPELDEDYASLSPADSASPLTHAQEEYCDACDRTADRCVCDQEEVDEGRMKDIDIDLSQLTDEEFLAKYGKTKEQVIQSLSEGLEGLKKWTGGALAAGTMAAAGLSAMNQQAIDNDPYIQQLQQQYQQVMQASDQAYSQGDMTKVKQLQAKKDQLEDEIGNAEAAVEQGVDPRQSAKINAMRESLDDVLKLAGL